MPEPAAAPAHAEETTEIPTTKPFGTFLQEHRKQGLHNEASEGLQEVVAAVKEHKKGGSLTITIDVKPGEVDGTLVVSDKVKVKAPEAERPTSLFYSDSRGNLSRRDPRQSELPGVRDASAE